MRFIHRPYQPGDTIAAIATPPGEGGIAIIRISGSSALSIAQQVFSGPVLSYHSHTVHWGIIKDKQGNKIDETLLLVMRAPRSYTGEDTVELHCHGGAIASKKVLEAVLVAGARPAVPGEFTFQAFMNGKIDLTQAESVQRLIGAKNEQAFEIAGRHLEGVLSKKISSFQEDLVRVTAILEAWVDFPEEGIEFATLESLLEELSKIKDKMQALLDTYHDGQRIEEGISLCIAGPPNAGKSSLMNALLQKERAIVTPIAGTTRDLIQEDLMLNGLHFRLIDTAGIRETEEIVEQEGIRRSKHAMDKADLILLVFDAAKPFGAEEETLLKQASMEKTIVIWNKIDLPVSEIKAVCPYEVRISAKDRIGLDQLAKTIDRLIWQQGAPPKDEVLITTIRHKEALSQAIQGVSAVIKGLIQDVSPEFLTADLRKALMELGRIIGTDVGEDILSSIFSQFCIGK